MRYPKLVPKRMCNTPIHVNLIQEGVSEDGGPLSLFEADLACNYQDNAKTVLTADKKLIQLSGTAIFHEDFCPDVKTISGGTVQVNGAEREIHRGMKARNPDGSVNYIRLDLV